MVFYSCYPGSFFENVAKGVSLILKQRPLNGVIPVWSAGIRLTWMFPEGSLRAWMPAIHAGTTESAFSFSMGERKVMNHFVVRSNCLFEIAVAHG